MYESYKSSDDYKESKLTEEDYLFASHQTRAFTYHSLNDEKAAFEGKRDLILAAGVVILTIFCPPAGAVAGVALATADMYSAAVGKDWMTGRELDDGERLMRGAFALFDIVPGVGYLNDLAKTGKVAGLAGIKASLKTSFKEGVEQAAKNVDNFKTVLKNVDDFRKQLITKVDDFGKQLDNVVANKVSSLADNVAGKLRHVDETLSTAAQNFRLNIGLEPQLIDGFMPTPPPGKLSGLADNIQAFAKSLDGSVDEVVESGAKTKVPYGKHIVKGKYGKKQLLPDIQYVSDQGYKYTTDSLGRIVSVEADELVLDKASRNLYSQRKVGGADRLADDDGGHLIASMFKGSGDIDNLVAMNSDINRSGGVWFDMEQEWKKALSEVPPKKVSVNIDPIYANGGLRPTEFKVRYYIEGNDPMVRRIINRPGG